MFLTAALGDKGSQVNVYSPIYIDIEQLCEVCIVPRQGLPAESGHSFGAPANVPLSSLPLRCLTSLRSQTRGGAVLGCAMIQERGSVIVCQSSSLFEPHEHEIVALLYNFI